MQPATTIEFIDAIRARYNLDSDGKAAGLLGISRQRISKYRTGDDGFGEETAERVSTLLDLELGYVLACIQAERTKRPETKAAWEKIAHSFAAAIGAVFVGVSTLGSPTPAQASPAVSQLDGVYIIRCMVCPGRQPRQ